MKPKFLLLLIFVSVVSGNGLDGLFDLGQFGLDGGGGLGELKLDEQMAQRVRALIKHFKADDPVGLPEGMLPIKEPITVPNLEQTFSGTKMKFENISLYGINKFRLDHVRVALSDLKVTLIWFKIFFGLKVCCFFIDRCRLINRRVICGRTLPNVSLVHEGKGEF